MTLDEARQHVGDGVVYQQPFTAAEYGVITSVNERWVFVTYRDGLFPIATPAEELHLLATGR